MPRIKNTSDVSRSGSVCFVAVTRHGNDVLDGGKITLDASFSREEMVAAAKTDIAWRYALRELNAFVIPNIDYSRHNTDGSLDLYNPATGQGAMTDLYLADRAAMLTWKIRYDKGYKDDNDGEHLGAKPYYETWDSNATNGDWDFIDYTERRASGAALKLSINGKGDAAANDANWRKAA